MSSSSTVPEPLLVSLGDPAGIGPEVLLKALALRPALRDQVRVHGDAAALSRAAAALGLATPPAVEPAPEPGPPSALWALERVVESARSSDGRARGGQGRAGHAIVTAPITKSDLAELGWTFPGQTEFLGARLGAHPTMMLAGPELRVALVTTHLPLRQVADRVTTDAVLRTVRATHAGLRDWFGISSPTLAVLGLNPHAGESRVLGGEDEDVVAPAVAAARDEGIDARGPLPADAAFCPRSRRRYDAHVAMYHDQGLTALKAIEGGRAVNLTLGLPVPRTSPDHGSARDIAGRGIADPSSMVAALDLAARMVRAAKRCPPTSSPG